MKYIHCVSHRPQLNLALEEYIFTHYMTGDYLMIWQNEESLIIGKHQNAFEEVDCVKTEIEGIAVIRRITGGGAVYHDMGNLNFSFITDWNPDADDAYRPFLEPIIKALANLGVAAHAAGICDIAIGDRKISGNAQTIKKNRILHHGTLLFNADLDKLKALLKPTTAEVSSKAHKSVRQEVTNIYFYTKGQVNTVKELHQIMLDSLFAGTVDILRLNESEWQIVERLATEKYNSWEWNYGQSPPCRMKKEFTIGKQKFNSTLAIKDGKIIDCRISCTAPDWRQESFDRWLIGQNFEYRQIVSCILAWKDKPAWRDWRPECMAAFLF